MNLYQAGYTRIGKQGEGAGWSIVSPSDGMSQTAMDGFSGYAGNLAELVKNGDMPGQAIGLFSYERFLYYMHINYQVTAEDARGVSFTHGYCFNLNDYYALCEKPEMLLGVTDNTFLKNYDATVTEYPVASELPYGAMNYAELKAKYQLNEAQYKALLLGATSAIEGNADSLCIKVSCPKEQYSQVCLEIMYLIMRSIPYHLRVKLTFFSYKGGKTNVYFSDKVEGNNYFDLDTKEASCDTSYLNKFRFTQIYNIEDDKLRQNLLLAIAMFMNDSFNVPLKDMSCEHIEHGFQAKLKNILSKAIDKDLTINLLTSFMSMPLKESDEVDEYLAVLLDSINQNGLAVENKGLLNRVVNRARNSANQALQSSYLDFYARQILAGEKTEAFDILWRLYQDDVAQYNILIESVKRMDEAFYQEYYRTVYLPQMLDTVDSIIKFFEENGRGSVQIDDSLNTLIYAVTENEMKQAHGFQAQYGVHEKAKRLSVYLADYGQEYADHYLMRADLTLWSGFDISQYSPKQIDMYKKCSKKVLATAEAEGNRRAYDTLKTVQTLNGVFENVSGDMDARNVYRILFTDSVITHDDAKSILHDYFRKKYLPQQNLSNVTGFDMALICNYNMNAKKFSVSGLLKCYIETKYENVIKTGRIKALVENSNLLTDYKLLERFKADVTAELNRLEEQKGADKKYKNAVKMIYSSLLNHEDEDEVDEDGYYSDEDIVRSSRSMRHQEREGIGLHKIAVGYLPLFTIAFFLLCLKKYAGFSTIAVICMAVIFVFVTIFAVVMKISQNGGVADYLEGVGINTIPKLIIAISSSLVLVLSTIVVAWFMWKNPALQQEPFYKKTVIGMVTIAVYIIVAIVGAIVGNIGEDE